MPKKAEKITIDGKVYSIDLLSEDTKDQLISLNIVDEKIVAIQQELAIHQTARIAYAKAVKNSLPDE